MNDIERLVAIEDIKQVKSMYFYGLDHRDWDLWRQEVWAADGRLEVPEFRSEPFAGVENIIAYVSDSTADQVSVHHGHMPSFAFRSDGIVEAIWAMEDRLFGSQEYPLYDGSVYLHGFGHYHETYLRLAQGWRIQSSRLTRLRVETRKVY